jgi:hypothetical protein
MSQEEEEEVFEAIEKINKKELFNKRKNNLINFLANIKDMILEFFQLLMVWILFLFLLILIAEHPFLLFIF